MLEITFTSGTMYIQPK